jgi:hypothetical protein
VLSGGE